MPTYEYECQACHRRVEAVQRFTDPALTVCEHCGGELRKVFSAVGVVFKGSGFYKTDSRGTDKSSTSTSTTPAASNTESSATPAATPASTSTTTTPSTTSD